MYRVWPLQARHVYARIQPAVILAVADLGFSLAWIRPIPCAARGRLLRPIAAFRVIRAVWFSCTFRATSKKSTIVDSCASSNRRSAFSPADASRPPEPHERGLKDTVYLGENETIRVLARFGPNEGKYMLHCHNVVHEDHDTMHQFGVGTGGADPLSVPAKPLPAPPL